MKFLLLLLTTAGLACPLRAAEEGRGETSAWARSVVQIEVTRKLYDYTQPWTKRQRKAQKCGLVIGAREILTTADDLFDHTLVRLQKGGRGRWWTGRVQWIDYPANLAILTAEDEGFWAGLQPARLESTLPTNGALQIVRWREGKLESRSAEFSQFTVREGVLAAVNHVHLEVGCEIQGVGRGEPVVANSHAVGLLTAQDGRTCVATPAYFIQSILEARRQNTFRGLGFFHFVWQPAENVDSLRWLKLPGEPRGVLVIDVPARPDSADSVLRRRDIILEIDGFAVDTEGDYEDPIFGPLMVENLSTRGRWAGDEIPMRIWRDGQELKVSYRLPKFAYTNSLSADAVFDQEPEYLIVGGLVFQPLTDAYLQSWGADWKRRAPFRLNFYNNEAPTPERPSLVLLTQVLPDPFNIGYQDHRNLVLDKVNQRLISRLTDLQEALKSPVNGFHIIEFMRGDSLRRMVVAAGEAESRATGRVLERYGIARSAVIQAGIDR
ncbi:MAG TPA: hypothetical protein VNO52_01170 [Methylomirabilota bacterium]|nr:hypothetical protein [Methylomirabilota bacterium]